MRLVAWAEVDGFRAARDKTIRLLETMVQRAPIKAATAAVDHARANHVFKDQTGVLRTSIKADAGRISPRWTWVRFNAHAPYALFVEGGTRPHEIWPKEGHGFIGPLRSGQSRRAIDDIGTHRIALRWYVGSRPVFARMVNHPGTDARPFMWPAAYHGEDTMVAYFRRGFVALKSIWT